MKIIFLSLVLISCSTKPDLSTEKIKIKIINLKVNKGKVISWKIPRFTSHAKNLTCKSKKGKIKFPVNTSKKWISGFISASYFGKVDNYNCFIGKQQVAKLAIRDFPYKKEFLNVDKKRVFLNDEDLARVIKEKEIKKKIYKNSSPYLLFEEEFVAPLNSYITSHYGNKRIFNKKKQSQHLGNDFRAAVGTPIPVSNGGRVVYTGNLFFTGNMVAIDHGQEIFSVYAHLSQIKVSVGDRLKKGDIVGLSGKTGRVSGPHLHWGVKINGHWIDGFSLVEASEDYVF